MELDCLRVMGAAAPRQGAPKEDQQRHSTFINLLISFNQRIIFLAGSQFNFSLWVGPREKSEWELAWELAAFELLPALSSIGGWVELSFGLVMGGTAARQQAKRETSSPINLIFIF